MVYESFHWHKTNMAAVFHHTVPVCPLGGELVLEPDELHMV